MDLNEQYILASILLQQAISFRERDPDHALQMMERGRVIAETLNDPCLTLSYDHWLADLLLFCRNEYARSLDHLIRVIVEARKPQYENCADRVNLYQLLIEAYLFNDPIGYEREIRETIHATETTMIISEDMWCLLQWCRAYLELAIGDLDAALHAGEIYLARCEKSYSNFRLSDAYSFLCETYYRRGEIDALQAHAEAGETHAHQEQDTQRWHVEFIAWQAYAAQRQGRIADAQQQFKRALLHLSRLHAPLFMAGYDALCDYYTFDHQWDAAQALRDRQLSEAVKSDSPYILIECYLRRIALAKAADRTYHDEWIAAQQILPRLQKPDHYRLLLSKWE
ncbi:MAG: hypothetical protein MUF87_19300 [Anaerolineae bacterium]|jgi:hypothetical protein|nr:hypothetical protein [Anaerolineae bacterium]